MTHDGGQKIYNRSKHPLSERFGVIMIPNLITKPLTREERLYLRRNWDKKTKPVRLISLPTVNKKQYLQMVKNSEKRNMEKEA